MLDQVKAAMHKLMSVHSPCIPHSYVRIPPPYAHTD